MIGRICQLERHAASCLASTCVGRKDGLTVQKLLDDNALTLFLIRKVQLSVYLVGTKEIKLAFGDFHHSSPYKTLLLLLIWLF